MIHALDCVIEMVALRLSSIGLQIFSAISWTLARGHEETLFSAALDRPR